MPDFVAGQDLTADDLNWYARGLHAYKSADETVNNSATFQNDDHLFVSVQANGVYDLFLYAVYSSGGTPDFKEQFTAPAGAALEASFFDTNGGAFQWSATGALGAVTALAGTGANAPFVIRATLFMGGNSGTLQWQWAQNTANASDTIVRKGSRLSLLRLD